MSIRKYNILFYSYTTNGFYSAISSAISNTKYPPTVISISWGAPEIDYQTGTYNIEIFNNLFSLAAKKE